MSVDPPEEMSSCPYHGHVCVCVCLHDPECVSVGACVSASAHASLVCMYVCVMGSFPAAGSVGTP